MPFHPAEQADAWSVDSSPDAPPEGERWSSWDGATHGPKPRPSWVITDLGAVDADLGVLRTGKEADVHLLRRWVPGTERAVTMAAKRYRGSHHRLFHRDAGYLEGRRVRKSREMRAMRRRTDFGKQLIAGQWVAAEFGALGTLWDAGLPVPYPVQLDDAELLMEFIGTAGVAAPRLYEIPVIDVDLADLFEQFRAMMGDLVALGWTHGDLSPYNVLVHDGRIIVIDWPQVVDVIGNPQGFGFLERDVMTMCEWFSRKGVDVDGADLFGELAAQASQLL